MNTLKQQKITWKHLAKVQTFTHSLWETDLRFGELHETQRLYRCLRYYTVYPLGFQHTIHNERKTRMIFPKAFHVQCSLARCNNQSDWSLRILGYIKKLHCGFADVLRENFIAKRLAAVNFLKSLMIVLASLSRTYLNSFPVIWPHQEIQKCPIFS